MIIKIYQIVKENDVNRERFLGSQEKEELFGSFKVNPSIYENVFIGDVGTTDLEEIFKIFNTEGHPIYRGTSMSVSDVVVIDGVAYYCDSIGWKIIDFDEEETMMKENVFKVVYVEPHKFAYTTYIEDSYEGESQAVKGMIQLLYNNDGTIIVCNDEGKLIGMEGNRHIEGTNSIIAGPFFIIGDEGEDFRSLTDEEANKYENIYFIPEDISQEEVMNDMGITIYEF